MPRYPYPYVECDRHHGPQLGYAVCYHICNQTAKPVHIIEASDEELGEATCAVCHGAKKLGVSAIRLICKGCFREFLAPVEH